MAKFMQQVCKIDITFWKYSLPTVTFYRRNIRIGRYYRKPTRASVERAQRAQIKLYYGEAK